MAKTVADQFAETLAAAGVKRIYGIIGDSLNVLTDSIRRQGKIEWVHVRHEEVAAFAAGAEAHLTGELSVCAGNCGPGNLDLINSLFDCQGSRVPVLAIAAQIPSAELGAGYFQETHPETLFKECSHYCELISGATTVVLKTKKSRSPRPSFKLRQQHPRVSSMFPSLQLLGLSIAAPWGQTIPTVSYYA